MAPPLRAYFIYHRDTVLVFNKCVCYPHKMSTKEINFYPETITETTTCIAGDTVSLTSYTITVPPNNGPWESEYDVGTTLLRDYAQRSRDYLEKKEISQYGWKSRRELRNV